jgi:hypothetical protein
MGHTWLDRPLSGSWCALGWLAASALFVGLVRILGGPSQHDAVESVYSTYAIAHGDLSCAYLPHNIGGYAFISPLWPLISGGLAALTRIGHQVPFPSQAILGPHCSTASNALLQWATHSGAPLRVIGLGYASWLVLMGGVIALLRATGRGRCIWEPMVLILVACVPPVSMGLVQYFHPQDLVAIGLALGGLACARRSWWGWAGMLLGLAVASQQFTLLVLAPLLVVAPSHRRKRFAFSTIAMAALILVPVIAITSGRALRAVVIGSGNTPSLGGTVLWETHLHGAPLVAVSRILPIVISMVLARWAVKRIGSDILEPLPLLSLMATSLSLRLVFEQNLFGYYFMAIAVFLVLLAVVRGQIGWQLVAWLVMVILAFTDVVPWSITPIHALPIWFWQVALVSTGVAMAAEPLMSLMHHQPEVEPRRMEEGPVLVM